MFEINVYDSTLFSFSFDSSIAPSIGQLYTVDDIQFTVTAIHSTSTADYSIDIDYV